MGRVPVGGWVGEGGGEGGVYLVGAKKLFTSFIQESSPLALPYLITSFTCLPIECTTAVMDRSGQPIRKRAQFRTRYINLPTHCRVCKTL